MPGKNAKLRNFDKTSIILYLEMETLAVRRQRFLREISLALPPSANQIYSAFRRVDRWQFTPRGQKRFAYENKVVQLTEDSTISKPVLVAEMMNLLNLGSGGIERILEVGTGSGYGTALLSCCCNHVFSIERNPRLAAGARRRLEELGYENVSVIQGDGALGLPEQSPFDRIIVNAAVKRMPTALGEQLATRGRIVFPEGERLIRGIKFTKGIEYADIQRVRFVSLISNEEGGWTEEEIEEEKRKRALVRAARRLLDIET